MSKKESQENRLVWVDDKRTGDQYVGVAPEGDDARYARTEPIGNRPALQGTLVKLPDGEQFRLAQSYGSWNAVMNPLTGKPLIEMVTVKESEEKEDGTFSPAERVAALSTATGSEVKPAVGADGAPAGATEVSQSAKKTGSSKSKTPAKESKTAKSKESTDVKTKTVEETEAETKDADKTKEATETK